MSEIDHYRSYRSFCAKQTRMIQNVIHLEQYELSNITYHVLLRNLFHSFPGNFVKELRLCDEHLILSGNQTGHAMITLLLCNRWMENGNLVNISDFQTINKTGILSNRMPNILIYANRQEIRFTTRDVNFYCASRTNEKKNLIEKFYPSYIFEL